MNLHEQCLLFFLGKFPSYDTQPQDHPSETSLHHTRPSAQTLSHGTVSSPLHAQNTSDIRSVSPLGDEEPAEAHRLAE